MEDYKTRLQSEIYSLHDKTCVLDTSLSSEDFKNKVGDTQYALMQKQLVGMRVYLEALIDRAMNLNLVIEL